MKVIKLSDGKVAIAKFCGKNIPDYVDPEALGYRSGLPFNLNYIEMCQKLVTTSVFEEYRPKIPFKTKMRWELKALAFIIREFNHQIELKVNKVLFVSDLHYGSKDLKEKEKDIHSDLISLMKKSKPDCLIFLGDVLDLWAIAKFKKTDSSHVIKEVLKIKDKFREYSELCKAILYLPGNHDMVIGKEGSKIREIVQFEWKIENFVVCDDLCLRGALPIPKWGDYLPGFAMTVHGHENSKINNKDIGMGRVIANSYQWTLDKPIIHHLKKLRPVFDSFEKIPYLGDREHRKLMKFGLSLPDVSLIAGHTHRPFIKVQRSQATFESLGDNHLPIDDWYRWYINIGSWGYQRSYLLIENEEWALGAYKKRKKL